MFIIRRSTRGHIFLRRKSVNNLTYSILSNAFDASNAVTIWGRHEAEHVLLKISFNPIRFRLFQTANDSGGGGFKSPPPPLRSQKLLCQSSPYHTDIACIV